MRRLSLLMFFLFTAFSQAAEKPNLVLIFIDDMGYGDIGPFGSKLNRTPNLDRMAAEGMKLTSFYAAPVCSASRAQLMTGSYAPRVSVPGVFFPAGKNGLNPREHTVADYLRESGYATMCVGKWHLGDQREFLPTNNGFDGYYGIPYSNDMARASSVDGRRVHPLLRDTEPEELLEDEGQRRITRLYTEEAVKFIKASKEKEKPFFLYMPHTAMHVPLFPHEDFAGKSNNGTYGDWVEEVDWSVGKVLTTLKELGLDEDTLVVFTSDNGPWASKGKAGGVAGPLRGSKGCTLEGGVREPTIVRWPGKIAAGSSCDAIAGTTDILPTFVSLAGGKLKDDVKIDGVDLSPVLTGKAENSSRRAWYYFQGNTLQAVRSGPWKLALTSQSIGMGMKEKPEDLKKPMRLYNLDHEIGEVSDVAAENPQVVARLQKLAESMAADIARNKRPAGTVENPVTLYPTQERSKKKRPPGKVRPMNWTAVKIGDVVDPATAPQIAGQGFQIRCVIEGSQPSGIILAHGGSSIGYALYITANDELVFAVRHRSDLVKRVTLPLKGKGKFSIVADLAKDGTLSLSLDEAKAVTVASPGALKKQPQENLCIGHDDKNPLDEKAPGGMFKGAIPSIELLVR
ncbi:sulfatase [Akkermansiaceae bacterium]|nr:sulfatase [Akkermansiaceae bacterium]